MTLGLKALLRWSTTSAEVELKVGLTGLAIRDFLLETGEGSANDVLRALRKVKKKTSYDSVRRYARAMMFIA